MPDTWTAVLARARLSEPQSGRYVLVAAAPDASMAFGSMYSDTWSGVVAASSEGSATRISAFTDSANDQIVGAAFDGRWLIWSESHSPSDWNDWDIMVWDSQTGAVTHVASAPRVDGQTVSGPFILPAASSGHAAWVQANESGKGELHLYSLADQRDEVLAEGDVVPPVAFWGPDVMWVVKDQQYSGHLEMAVAATGEPVTVPGPLASVQHFGSLAATSDLLAWDDARSLWIWDPGDDAPGEIFRADIGDYVEFVGIAGDLIAWTGSDAEWAADLRSGAVTRISGPYGGSVSANGNGLLLNKLTGPVLDKSSPPASETDLVDATKLPPLPGCDS